MHFPAVEIVESQTKFTVWAPLLEKMTLHLVHPVDAKREMIRDDDGYFSVTIDSVLAGARYYYAMGEDKEFPDPGSHFQPDGVHGPSQVIDHTAYRWNDAAWKGIALEEMVLYELHVGTFTHEGTFDAIIPRLDELKETGINAIELLPVSQFPGTRNWGYDGAYPYAVQNSYGGPLALKRLVDACHQKGIAVILDVVYNHIGPEGNYFSSFGPYFTSHYRSVWGDAINFDGEWSDGVRDFFSWNAVYWLEYFHIDGLRCDAVHAVYDNGAVHFWQLLHNKIKTLENKMQRRFHLIAESDLNDPKVIRGPEAGGFGFDAQWLDDFHHALYVLVNPGDKERYYDFKSIHQLAKAFKEGFVHTGEWVKFRKRKFGASSAGIPGHHFIVFTLNHDQAGNRPMGERLGMMIDHARLKISAAAMMFSPYIPMLFMGEEYGDDTPFYYFVSHSDEELVEAVRKGRANEFREFGFQSAIDPQDEKTFTDSIIHWEKRNTGKNSVMHEWYKRLISFRRTLPVLKNFNKDDISTEVIDDKVLLLIRQTADQREKLLVVFNFSEHHVAALIPGELSGMTKILDASEMQWQEDPVQDGPVHDNEVGAGQNLSILPLTVVAYYSKK